MAEIIRRVLDAYLAWDDPTYTPVPKLQTSNAPSSPPYKERSFLGWAL